jgi:hypothetical protein
MLRAPGDDETEDDITDLVAEFHPEQLNAAKVTTMNDLAGNGDPKPAPPSVERPERQVGESKEHAEPDEPPERHEEREELLPDDEWNGIDPSDMQETDPSQDPDEFDKFMARPLLHLWRRSRRLPSLAIRPALN